MSDLKYEITQNLGTIGEGTKGWKKEVNIVAWNGRRPKIDIRDWDEEHKKMGKGITLRKEEAVELKRILQDIDLGSMDIV